MLLIRSLMVVAPAAALAVACSQPEPAATGNDRGEAGVGGADYHGATARSAEFPTPDTGSAGRFLVEKGCLVFVAQDGARHLPVFPLGTRFGAASGAAPVTLPGGGSGGGGAVLGLDRRYMVKGGAGEYRLDPPPPASCPARQFLIGGLL